MKREAEKAINVLFVVTMIVLVAIAVVVSIY